ncbi:MAG: hypothetical protein U0992_04325 [Planctomycetaceae bacterium]
MAHTGWSQPPTGDRRTGGCPHGELFQAFKEHFEFIIVDGPPVLPVVDTRLVRGTPTASWISLLLRTSASCRRCVPRASCCSHKVRILEES